MRKKRARRASSSGTSNILPKLILVVLIVVVIVLFNGIFKNLRGNSGESEGQNPSTSETGNSGNSKENEKPVEVAKPDTTFTMAVTGDIMCHNTMFWDSKESSGGYDFSHFFTDIKYYLQTADITVGNLETTFAGSKRGYSGYPCFNTPEELAKNLKSAGFNVVSTANNHCMDTGISGLESTLEYLDDADLAHTGTFASEEDQEDILIQDVKGVKIAFLSYTYGTNGIPVPKANSYAVNLIDKDLIEEHIELAKKKNPDLIVACMHWGVEYQIKENSTQDDLADFLFEHGVDIILGNHPHVPQPMEVRTVELEDGSKKDGFVIFSLGNFMANQNYKYTQDTAIVNLKITKSGKTGDMSIDKVTYTPVYVYKNANKSTHKFRLLDIEKEIELYENDDDDAVGKALYNTLVTECKNIKNILGDEIDEKIELKAVKEEKTESTETDNTANNSSSNV